MAKREPHEITTIKLEKKTKERIEKLRLYNRESYDEIVQRMLEILNMCVLNPQRARANLIALERKRKKERRLLSARPLLYPQKKAQ